MKKLWLYSSIVLALVAVGYFTLSHFSHAKWSGVDETVVEKYARAAGHPPHRPLIDTDQGDLLLFCFLLAGIAGGFVMGYYIRDVFPPDPAGSPAEHVDAASVAIEAARQ
jgi:hypothetical protein